MIRQTIQNTIQNTIRNTLGDAAFDMLDLFSGGQQGVWYDPSDLATLYQDINGKPVIGDGYPVGMMLDKSRGTALGDELITNGTFDTDVSGWSAENAVISVDSGNLVVDDTANAGTDSAAYQDITTVQGKHYFISLNKVSTTTEFYLRIGSSPSFQDIAYSNLGVSAGTYFYRFIATDSTTRISVITGLDGVTKYDNISVKEITGNFARQLISTQRPTYNSTPDRLTLDLVDDSLAFTVPTGGIDGYMVVGTDEGTASYGVSLPAGDYDIGGDFFMGGSVNGFLLREGDVSASDLSNVEKDFVSKGAKASYGDVTNFNSYWREKNITEFPLIDTSSGTNFAYAWFWITTLTSFPALDFSNSINFSDTWRFNTSLTNFPANMFDNCNATNFNNAFVSTNLSQSSIDGILVSIESNGTSNGTIGQSGGSAPSATGEAAIDAMRSRGWTITVTGGY